MRNKFIIAEIALAILGVGLITFIPTPTAISGRSQVARINENKANPVRDDSAHSQHTLKLASPESIAASFTLPLAKQPQVAVESPAIAQQPSISDWIKVLGTIRGSDGIERVYFKDSRTGRIIKARRDGKTENGIALVISNGDVSQIRIDGTMYTLPGGI